MMKQKVGRAKKKKKRKMAFSASTSLDKKYHLIVSCKLAYQLCPK